jgi:SMC interacting uncharacterized protein involved in chromosome segregation
VYTNRYVQSWLKEIKTEIGDMQEQLRQLDSLKDNVSLKVKSIDEKIGKLERELNVAASHPYALLMTSDMAERLRQHFPDLSDRYLDGET